MTAPRGVGVGSRKRDLPESAKRMHAAVQRELTLTAWPEAWREQFAIACAVEDYAVGKTSLMALVGSLSASRARLVAHVARAAKRAPDGKGAAR